MLYSILKFLLHIRTFPLDTEKPAIYNVKHFLNDVLITLTFISFVLLKNYQDCINN